MIMDGVNHEPWPRVITGLSIGPTFLQSIALKNGTLAAHWLVKSGSSTYAYNVNIAQSGMPAELDHADRAAS